MAKSRNAQPRSQGDSGETPVPYHHSDLRQALVSSACQLLGKNGLSALSLREVARRSGVSQAAPYRHFPDKAALLAAVAAEGFRGLSRTMAESAEGIDARAERFRALGRGYVRFALDNPSMLRLMFGAELGVKCDHPELQQAAADAYAMLSNTAASVVGEPSTGAPNTLALAAWSLVHGLSQLLIDGQVSVGEAEEVEALVDRVISKLRP